MEVGAPGRGLIGVPSAHALQAAAHRSLFAPVRPYHRSLLCVLLILFLGLPWEWESLLTLYLAGNPMAKVSGGEYNYTLLPPPEMLIGKSN